MEIRGIICILLGVYSLILLVRVLASWFPIPPSGPVRVVMDLVYDVTEPLIRPVRGLLPPVRMGALGLDLSPLIVIIFVNVLRLSIC